MYFFVVYLKYSPHFIQPAEDKLLDTVGVISIDKRGQVVSALSSGGIALKRPGRVGQVDAGCLYS